MSDLGTRVRELRGLRGLAQSELARLTGLSNGYVSLVETGQRHPSAHALSALAAALGTTAAYLTGGDAAPSERSVAATVAAAELALDEGDASAAHAMLTSLDPAHVSRANRLAFLRALGNALDQTGRVDDSIEVFEQALVVAREDGLTLEVAALGMWLVGAHLESGTLSRSVEVGIQVLAEVEAAGAAGSDEHLRLGSTVLWALFERGDLLQARTRARVLTQVAEERGSARGRGSVYWNAALIAQGCHEDDRALDLAQRALDALIESGSARDVARMRYDYGYMLLRTATPQPRVALQHLTAAQSDLERFGSTMEVARLHIEQARAHLMVGWTTEADKLATKGLALLGGVVNLDACEARIVLGDVAFLRGDMPTAERRYRWAAERLEMMAARARGATVWAALGARLRSTGDLAGAVRAYRAALDTSNLPSVYPVIKPLAAPAATQVPELRAALSL